MDTRPTRITPLYHSHLALHASIVQMQGWLHPEKYGDIRTEVELTRSNAGLCDLSFPYKLDVRGRGLLKTVESLLGVSDISIGRILPLSNSNSTDPPLTCVLNDQHFLILILEMTVESLRSVEELFEQTGATLTDVTSGYSIIQLTGPSSLSVLSKLTDADLRTANFSNYSCGEWGLAEVRTVILRRDIGNLPNFMMLIPADHSQFVWRQLLQAGGDYHLRPYGLAALRILEGRGV
jgi:glycine cleavage system aminomethyltransferase T